MNKLQQLVLRNSLSRQFGSSSKVSSSASKAALSPDGNGLELRPAPAQAETMLDMGTRNIFSPEQDMFRSTVRKFVREEMAPQQAKFEEDGQPSRDIWLSLGKNGLLGKASF